MSTPGRKLRDSGSFHCVVPLSSTKQRPWLKPEKGKENGRECGKIFCASLKNEVHYFHLHFTGENSALTSSATALISSFVKLERKAILRCSFVKVNWENACNKFKSILNIHWGTTSTGFCTSSHPYHLSSKHNEFLEIEFKKGHSKKTIIVLLPHQPAPAYSSIHSKRYYRPPLHQKLCSSLMLKQRKGLVHSSGAHSTREGRNRGGIMIQ